MAWRRKTQVQPKNFGEVKLPAVGRFKAEQPVKKDVYQAITDLIIERLEQGTVPWLSPSIARVGYPRNFSTQKFYSGINVFLLGCQEFASPYFLTYKQAVELGGHVKKGEKGFPIIKVGEWIKKAPGQNGEGESSEEQSGIKRKFLKMYVVFNACQIEGVDFPEPPKCESYSESKMADEARAIVEKMPNPPQIFEGRMAYPHYIKNDDVVQMPAKETFRAEWRYYKTLFHELAHATGHEKRLNRRTLVENRGMYVVGDAKKIYCEEELVAEMTAAFLGAHAGIIEDDFANTTAYVKGWLDVLKAPDHEKWLIRAAGEAQKAADWILGK